MVTMPATLNHVPQPISTASQGNYYDSLTLEEDIVFLAFGWFCNKSGTHELDSLRIIISPSHGPKWPWQKFFQWAKFETVNVEFRTLFGRGYEASAN